MTDLERPDWGSVFERFPTGRVPLTRSVGIFLHDWSRPAEGHPRLFDRDALERLTSARPRMVATVYTLLALALVADSARAGLPLGTIAALALSGLVLWTLTEYLMHRFAFHFVPKTTLGVALAYLSHGVHHAYPRDPDRLVMPLIVSAPIAAALLVAGHVAFGRPASPFLGGFIAGYLAYDLIHYQIHRTEAPSGALMRLRRYHLQHHFSTPNRQFGVSSPLWDHVFGTHR